STLAAHLCQDVLSTTLGFRKAVASFAIHTHDLGPHSPEVVWVLGCRYRHRRPGWRCRVDVVAAHAALWRGALGNAARRVRRRNVTRVVSRTNVVRLTGRCAHAALGRFCRRALLRACFVDVRRATRDVTRRGTAVYVGFALV